MLRPARAVNVGGHQGGHHAELTMDRSHDHCAPHASGRQMRGWSRARPAVCRVRGRPRHQRDPPHSWRRHPSARRRSRWVDRGSRQSGRCTIPGRAGRANDDDPAPGAVEKEWIPRNGRGLSWATALRRRSQPTGMTHRRPNALQQIHDYWYTTSWKIALGRGWAGPSAR